MGAHMLDRRYASETQWSSSGLQNRVAGGSNPLGGTMNHELEKWKQEYAEQEKDELWKDAAALLAFVIVVIWLVW